MARGSTQTQPRRKAADRKTAPTNTDDASSAAALRDVPPEDETLPEALDAEAAILDELPVGGGLPQAIAHAEGRTREILGRLACAMGKRDHAINEALAKDLLAREDAEATAILVKHLDERETAVSVDVAKVLEIIAAASPKLLGPGADGLAAAIRSTNARTATVASTLLAVAAPAVPARVAKHLDALLKVFPVGAPAVRDALVRAFAGLCAASVAYQRRLGPVLEEALATCSERDLPRWAEVILPSLKGEPHARARAIVERRMPELPRPGVLRVAKLLGVKPPRAKA
ncbi:MAG: hypothetical protein IT379_26235 [Deltaproteobacteria bacterium]|nr:hypothetical protein [Deltaproteobacteria bacterium]